jgi:RNA polymerase primary sigma factor
LEREPTAIELAAILEIDEEAVAETMRMSGRHVSVDAPFQEGEEGTLLGVMESTDEPEPDKFLIHESLRKEIERSLSTLSEREREIICHYFGLCGRTEMSLEEVGEKFGLTRERVRQIKEKGIKRLKYTSRSVRLKSFLG